MRISRPDQTNILYLAIIGLSLLSLGLILYRPKGDPCPPPVFVPHGRDYKYVPDAGLPYRKYPGPNKHFA